MSAPGHISIGGPGLRHHTAMGEGSRSDGGPATAISQTYRHHREERLPSCIRNEATAWTRAKLSTSITHGHNRPHSGLHCLSMVFPH
jgi:hypothetical protein